MKAPAINFDASGIAAIAGILAIAGLGLWAYVKRDELGRALNITQSGNLADRGATALATAIAGREESVGTGLYAAKAAAGSWWRRLTGSTSPDDIDYSKAVTDAERAMVRARESDLEGYYGP